MNAQTQKTNKKKKVRAPPSKQFQGESLHPRDRSAPILIVRSEGQNVNMATRAATCKN